MADRRYNNERVHCTVLPGLIDTMVYVSRETYSIWPPLATHSILIRRLNSANYFPEPPTTSLATYFLAGTAPGGGFIGTKCGPLSESNIYWIIIPLQSSFAASAHVVVAIAAAPVLLFHRAQCWTRQQPGEVNRAARLGWMWNMSWLLIFMFVRCTAFTAVSSWLIVLPPPQYTYSQLVGQGSPSPRVLMN